MEVTRIFSFSAAHHLTDYHGDCERPHGHTYRLGVTVEGDIGKNGLVVDFKDIKKVVERKVLSKVDHRDLNDRFKNPTAENIAVWCWKQLKNIGKDTGAEIKLDKIVVWEGDNTSVEYEGD